MKPFRTTVLRADVTAVETPLLVLALFEGEEELGGAAQALDAALGGTIRRLLDRGDLRGRADEKLPLFPADLPAERVLLVGLGPREELDAEGLRRAAGSAVRHAEAYGATSLCVVPPAEADGGLDAASSARALAEGAGLAAWDYRELKTVADDDEPRAEVEELVLLAQEGEAGAVEAAARTGAVLAGAENLARELAAKPGNVATPSHLAEVAAGIAAEHGLEITVLDRAAMEEQGMGALLAVASGSEEEPRLIVLEYNGGRSGDAPLALVGKGVTFDSGGISIKPALKMEEMKYDMSGAAAVLGAMQAIAALELPVNVVGIVPSTENLPSGRAVKPGDVVRSHSGKTIEIINTDAEGRLILADALSYAQRFEPRAMLDAATLTGAVVIGLGHHAVGIMGTDDGVVEEVRAAGDSTGERCWPLPLWKEYRKQLDSVVADIQNTGGRPAGTITAAWFLREFVGDVPWVHLDVAGTAWRDEPLPYLRKGPTGVPTRLFVEWVRSRAEG